MIVPCCVGSYGRHDFRMLTDPFVLGCIYGTIIFFIFFYVGKKREERGYDICPRSKNTRWQNWEFYSIHDVSHYSTAFQHKKFRYPCLAPDESMQIRLFKWQGGIVSLFAIKKLMPEDEHWTYEYSLFHHGKRFGLHFSHSVKSRAFETHPMAKLFMIWPYSSNYFSLYVLEHSFTLFYASCQLLRIKPHINLIPQGEKKPEMW